MVQGHRVYKFEGCIYTDFSGCKNIVNLIHFCRDLTNTTIALDFYECEWFDANLAALLQAVIHKLHLEQHLSFSTDYNFIQGKFDVLFRNGFLTSDTVQADVQKTTVPLHLFAMGDCQGFDEYVKSKLLKHRGMPSLCTDLQEQISEDLMEIFANSNHHANTAQPFFVAGQYYPKEGYLKFTLVDLGHGFLPRIQLATDGAIKDDLSAIKWALEGNSSKLKLDHTPGGLGLRNMLRYVNDTSGNLQILSNGAYWSTDHRGTIFEEGRVLQHPFTGSVINLFFKK